MVEEEAKRELLRLEKVRLAEERVVEERRARLLLEKAEHDVGYNQAPPMSGFCIIQWLLPGGRGFL